MPSRMSRARRRAIGGLVVAAAAVAAFVPFSCIPRREPTRPPSAALTPAPERLEARPVRVLLVDGAASATVACEAACRIQPTTPGSQAVAAGGHGALRATVVRPFPRGIHLGEQAVFHNALRIIPTRDATLAVNGRIYRGEPHPRLDVGNGPIVGILHYPIDVPLFFGGSTYNNRTGFIRAVTSVPAAEVKEEEITLLDGP